MKCPKCGYLGFETSDRCRNCGYDFSLAVAPPPALAPEIPLRSTEDAGEPLVDLALGELSPTSSEEARAELDLDRLIGDLIPPGGNDARDRGDAPWRQAGSRPAHASSAADPIEPWSEPDRPRRQERTEGPSRAEEQASRLPADLPLFSREDDLPPPAPPPLAVRRTTPEIPRRRAAIAPAFARPEPAVAAARPAIDETPALDASRRPLEHPASAGARLGAAVIDALLLAAIDAVVFYLTLALAGLEIARANVLPLAPLVAFFAILAGGYLVAFVAAGGQTIGKMIMGIRVLGDDGRRVDAAGAALRAAGCAVSLATAGLGYLPALTTADGRALHDRIAGTRVVRAD